MLKHILGSFVFVIAVFVVINIVGDLAIRPHTGATPPPQASEEPEAEAVEEDVAEQAEEPAPEAAAPVAEPAPTPQATPEPEAIPEPAPITAATATEGGDVQKGQKLFRKKCLACHTAEKGGKDRTGPNLWAIVGRDKAAAENFRYSKTMRMKGGVWSEAELSSFIAGPRTFIPDTKMTFAGLKTEAERLDVIAYLKTLTD